MATACSPLILYLHLARAAELRRRPLARDKLLVLAAVAAVESGLDPLAAFCRAKILEHNAGHLMRRFPDVATALKDERFSALLVRVERSYSRERAEHMLHSLGIELARERNVYEDENEYAAALLGTTPVELDAWYAQSQSAASSLSGDTGSAELTGAGRIVSSSVNRPAKRSPSRLRGGALGLLLVCGLFLLAGLIGWLAIRNRM